jgi:predicted  nucleic acid-binding Zn-ribbon protein
MQSVCKKCGKIFDAHSFDVCNCIDCEMKARKKYRENEGEKQMNALVELALTIEDEGRVPENVSPVVQAALEKHRAEKAEEASNDIVALLRQIEKHKLAKRSEIRKLKAQLKTLVAGLTDLDRRWAFAQTTSNFLPVLSFFDMVSRHDLADPSAFERLTQVPTDFRAE